MCHFTHLLHKVDRSSATYFSQKVSEEQRIEVSKKRKNITSKNSLTCTLAQSELSKINFTD